MTTTNTELEVFWVSGSPYAWRVLLTLEAKQLSYISHLLDASRGDLKAPEYLNLNPRGKAPTVRDGDLVLTESLAIMVYLDRKYAARPLFGRTARETARTWRLISEYLSYLDAPVTRIIAPIYSNKVAEKAEDIRAATPLVHAELRSFEASLGASPFFGGETISAADIAIYPFLKSLARAVSKDIARPLELGLLPLQARYTGLAAWIEHVERLPGYENTYPPHWREK